ncbi:hypothetical protein B6U66_01885 [Candidatus Bathyarchaeota archaeon ex4484_135]|nr:MAG: hypothetical protein B6U66_01885 [Candidatus Bathyarchaeota archaeon ex4484_135]RLI88922.1 MAG: hypothetical protein DRO65_04550 [Candidatus Altiarchaeales archaeon]
MVYVEGLRGLCLDTDILVDYLRGPSEVVMSLFRLALDKDVMLSTTVINAFEVWLGVFLAPEPDRISKPTEEFLNSLVILDLDYEAAKEAGRLMATLRRKGTVIDVRDLLAGCIAKRYGLPMVTRNLRHYLRIDGLRVLPPEVALESLEKL